MQNIEWLFAQRSRGIKLGLDRVRKLLEKIGNPEQDMKYIHVAGSNGKGSVCSMINSILISGGYKVGMYTSPHLINFNERYLINNIKISDDNLEKFIGILREKHTDESFFELATAIAFLYFKEEKCEYVVLEVGLGGRLDATNVIIPVISVITNISLEHTNILGESLEEIAREKAGIIKENIPVVTLATGKALKEIKKIANKLGSNVLIPKNKNYKTNLKGEFQKQNARIAAQVGEKLKIKNENITAGLMNAKWRGRMEFQNKILFDCAHNVEGIKALVIELKKIKSEKKIAVIGIMEDKDYKSMLKILDKEISYFIFAKPKMERSSNPSMLANNVSAKFEIVYNVKKALKKAKKIANPLDLIVVTGSIFTVGEALNF